MHTPTLHEQAEGLAARVWDLTEDVEDIELRGPLRRRAVSATIALMDASLSTNADVRFIRMQDAFHDTVEIIAILMLARRMGEIDSSDVPEEGYRELYTLLLDGIEAPWGTDVPEA